MHGIGVLCGLAAGVWLGAAEAPTKLVNTGLSPYAISLCMVAGVFTARWSLPTLVKGTRSVFADLARNKHLIPIAILAGMLWGVANTLTVFAIRDVGLAIAFPLWNTNSLVGILWGRVLFGELKGASGKNVAKVLLGALAIVGAAIMLGFSTIQGGEAHAQRAWAASPRPSEPACFGARCTFLIAKPISAASTLSRSSPSLLSAKSAPVFPGAGAGARWGTKAAACAAWAMLFWLLLGGFCWVIGDLFQQYATKYVGISRAIPLSNTNQLWGGAWGALVFGELAHADPAHRLLVVLGSVVMILGALAVSTAIATEREHGSINQSLVRECDRYGLDYGRVLLAYGGVEEPGEAGRSWWDYVIVAAAIGVFIWLGVNAQVPKLSMNLVWVAILTGVMVTAVSADSSSWPFAVNRSSARRRSSTARRA